MRLAAEAKMGFYPVQHATIDLICRSLSLKSRDIRILDPCCGAGMALEHLGKTLGVPKENLYGVELDARRAEEAAGRLGHVIHGSFFNAKIVPVQAFSLAWVNPPYDDELKQEGSSSKSLEVAFVEAVAKYVTPDGVIILHMPSDRVTDAVKMAMHSQCIEIHGLTLPKELRPYRETIIVGVKRKQIEKNPFYFRLHSDENLPVYEPEPGERIRTFDRLAPTHEEIRGGLAKAAFWRLFKAVPQKTKLKPILPLGAGHLGLTLASGYLDGYFAPDGYEPHVVRGIAYKEEQVVKDEQTESDDGKVTHTKTLRENIKLKIRAVNDQGTIHEIK